MSTIVAALWITLIGMGLVFIALILLWGLMALIVNGTARMAEAETAEAENEAEPAEAPAEVQPDAALLRRQAAAAAVAVALAMQKKAGAPIARAAQPALDAASFSAWQPVLRANQLTQKSRVYSRKQRGTDK